MEDLREQELFTVWTAVYDISCCFLTLQLQSDQVAALLIACSILSSHICRISGLFLSLKFYLNEALSPLLDGRRTPDLG